MTITTTPYTTVWADFRDKLFDIIRRDEFRPGGPGGAMVNGGAGNDVYVYSRGDGYFGVPRISWTAA
jgi:hypothetical protein